MITEGVERMGHGWWLKAEDRGRRAWRRGHGAESRGQRHRGHGEK